MSRKSAADIFEDSEGEGVEGILSLYDVYLELALGNGVETTFNTKDEARSYHSQICRAKKAYFERDVARGNMIAKESKFSIRMEWDEIEKLAKFTPVTITSATRVFRVFTIVEDQE